MRTHPALGRDGGVVGLSGTMSDVTERRRLEAELTHLAFHDPLTGLANRALFRDRVDHTLLLSRRTRQNGAVLFLDLDSFKSVNDSFGHAAGDRLLVEIAGRLQRCLRPGDTISRLGGDEFGILLEGVLEADAAEVAVRLSAVAREPVTLDEHIIVGSASIGIAMLDQGTASAGDALRNADVAMYVAKVRRAGGHAIFRPEMHLASVERTEDLSRLRVAIDQEELYLDYQPIIDLSTGRLTGVEALVRWHHPVRGIVPPAAFIPLAEESGLIVALGAWVTREACRQLRAWDGLAPGRPGPTMSINLSAVQLVNDGLVAEVADILVETGLDPHRLVFEITETGLMTDPDLAEQRLRTLKGLGVRIAIDDFGTGYSSLAYLRRFPIDVLKLDRTFISGLERNGPSAALAEIFVQLGRALHIETVAEGVETMGEAELLRDLDCQLAQGFQFSRPVDPACIAALLVADIPWEIGSPSPGSLAQIA
jgi:diguanylate cyclase (GGDEF)-like protein